MTREEIIEMARQAGFVTNEIKSYVISPYTSEDQDLYQELEAFATLVASAEREACAKVCEEYAIGLERNYSEIIADKIRARGKA